MKFHSEQVNRVLLRRCKRCISCNNKPTHFAVALKYEVGEEGAPKILAMGRGLMAEKI